MAGLLYRQGAGGAWHGGGDGAPARLTATAVSPYEGDDGSAC